MRLSMEEIDKFVPDLGAEFDDQKEGIKRFIKEQREALGLLLADKNIGGFEICRYNTEIFDAVVKKIYEIALASVGVEPNIAIFAAGGFGRHELCYFSDVDLCYTSDVDLEEEYDENSLRFIRIFYTFIDALSATRGIVPKFSFLYRPYCDVSKWNYQDLTALMDAGFLVGNSSLKRAILST